MDEHRRNFLKTTGMTAIGMMLSG
ncbi:MAG: twin-arginine translocation signal domain-containing protein, partial [Siphonobacter aquaeclarae]|nr:twin-arginine translocation signal domain-containing protein [Siphonobacter aquaeclarae]